MVNYGTFITELSRLIVQLPCASLLLMVFESMSDEELIPGVRLRRGCSRELLRRESLLNINIEEHVKFSETIHHPFDTVCSFFSFVPTWHLIM
jgi:hypothetical protein